MIRKKLEKDIAELLCDKNFIRLQKGRSAFNAFSVLNLKHHEIRHSNVLAWLFNPQESHKLGSAFLEQFLIKLTSCANVEKQTKDIHAVLPLLAKGGMHVRVRREVQSEDKKRLDLQIECLFPSPDKEKIEFVIIIENKIHAKQRDKQLAGYLNHAKDVFEGKNSSVKIIPVYLTLDEDDEPSDEVRDEYFHITYGAVLEILETLTDATSSERDGNPSSLFIRDYMKTLKELLNMNEKEQEYAKEIYRKYRNVIDFICTTGGNCITDAGKKFVERSVNAEQDTEYKVETIDKTPVHCFPFTDSVLKDTEGGVANDWRCGAACGYCFSLNAITGDDADGFKGKLALKIEVGPFDDSEKRQRLLKVLESKGIEKSNKKSKYYTRLSYKKVKCSKEIDDVTDVDEVAAAMEELFESTKKMRERLHEGIKEWKRQL